MTLKNKNICAGSEQARADLVQVKERKVGFQTWSFTLTGFISDAGGYDWTEGYEPAEYDTSDPPPYGSQRTTTNLKAAGNAAGYDFEVVSPLVSLQVGKEVVLVWVVKHTKAEIANKLGRLGIHQVDLRQRAKGYKGAQPVVVVENARRYASGLPKINANTAKQTALANTANTANTANGSISQSALANTAYSIGGVVKLLDVYGNVVRANMSKGQGLLWDIAKGGAPYASDAVPNGHCQQSAVANTAFGSIENVTHKVSYVLDCQVDASLASVTKLLALKEGAIIVDELKAPTMSTLNRVSSAISVQQAEKRAVLNRRPKPLVTVSSNTANGSISHSAVANTAKPTHTEPSVSCEHRVPGSIVGHCQQSALANTANTANGSISHSALANAATGSIGGSTETVGCGSIDGGSASAKLTRSLVIVRWDSIGSVGENAETLNTLLRLAVGDMGQSLVEVPELLIVTTSVPVTRYLLKSTTEHWSPKGYVVLSSGDVKVLKPVNASSPYANSDIVVWNWSTQRLEPLVDKDVLDHMAADRNVHAGTALANTGLGSIGGSISEAHETVGCGSIDGSIVGAIETKPQPRHVLTPTVSVSILPWAVLAKAVYGLRSLLAKPVLTPTVSRSWVTNLNEHRSMFVLSIVACCFVLSAAAAYGLLAILANTAFTAQAPSIILHQAYGYDIADWVAASKLTLKHLFYDALADTANTATGSVGGSISEAHETVGCGSIGGSIYGDVSANDGSRFTLYEPTTSTASSTVTATSAYGLDTPYTADAPRPKVAVESTESEHHKLTSDDDLPGYYRFILEAVGYAAGYGGVGIVACGFGLFGSYYLYTEYGGEVFNSVKYLLDYVWGAGARKGPDLVAPVLDLVVYVPPVQGLVAYVYPVMAAGYDCLDGAAGYAIRQGYVVDIIMRGNLPWYLQPHQWYYYPHQHLASLIYESINQHTASVIYESFHPVSSLLQAEDLLLSQVVENRMVIWNPVLTPSTSSIWGSHPILIDSDAFANSANAYGLTNEQIYNSIINDLRHAGVMRDIAEKNVILRGCGPKEWDPATLYNFVYNYITDRGSAKPLVISLGDEATSQLLEYDKALTRFIERYHTKLRSIDPSTAAGLEGLAELRDLIIQTNMEMRQFPVGGDFPIGFGFKDVSTCYAYHPRLMDQPVWSFSQTQDAMFGISRAYSQGVSDTMGRYLSSEDHWPLIDHANARLSEIFTSLYPEKTGLRGWSGNETYTGLFYKRA